MNCYSALWQILLCMLLNSVSYNVSLYHDHVPCFPVGNCKCEFPNGLGIDLSLLRGQNFSVNVAPQEELIYFPCKNVQIANITNVTVLNECESGVSLCHKVQNENKTFAFHNMGSLFESSFLWVRIRDDPALTFNHGTRSTLIKLNCDHSAKEARFTHTTFATGSNYRSFNSLPNYSLGQLIDIDSANFVLSLTTELACLTTVEEEGRSVFSTVFIIILVLFFVYLFGGFLVLRFIRGARGWEAIPNGEFWRSICTSIKQMFCYIMNGCRQPETYDTI